MVQRSLSSPCARRMAAAISTWIPLRPPTNEEPQFRGPFRSVGEGLSGAPEPTSTAALPSYIASTCGMISSLNRLRSSNVFATGTSWNGGHRSGIVSPTSL
jgi:hypothetical protein